MSKLKLIETIQTKLPTLSKTDGQLIVVRDNASLHIDLDGNRIYISDWIDISTDTDRLAMLTPLSNKYYYVVETNKIWRYIGGSWVLVTSIKDLNEHIEDTNVHITSTERTKWNTASTNSHTHSNKTVLDGITSALITAWNNAVTHISDTVKHITSTERTNWENAYIHSQSAHAPSGAEVNQNAFSNVVVGSTTISADSKTDSLTLVGSNVTLTPDATNDKVTIGITKANVTSALGYTPPTTNTTYSEATTSSNGLMSSVDKSKLDNVDSYATNIPFIVGTQTAVTGTWTGTTSEISSLVDGQTIRFWLPYNGSGNATLNLTLSDGTTTGAIACYWRGSTRLTTHYVAGSVITLTYRKSVSIAGSGSYTGWWADADFDSNTMDRIRYQQNIKCGTTAIVAGNIIVGNAGVYNHLKAGTAFDITYPILYANTAITASGTGTDNYLVRAFTVTTTQSITLTSYKPVFIKGSLNGTIFTPINTTPLTQTIPTTNDGYEYILLGVAYSSTAIFLLSEHPIFAYKGGAFGQISSKGITDLSVSGKTVTFTRGDGTTGTITTQDTTYSVATTSANGLMSATDKTKLDITNIAYATCSTAAATAAKVATIDGNTNWKLQKGSIVVVKYTNTNTASNVTLNVNNTGAKSIWYNTGVYTGNSNIVGGAANRITTFMYDGTNWVWMGQGADANTTYSPATLGQGYGTCTTAEATTAKVVTLSSYALVTGGTMSVKFTYAVPANATMNINSKGAKAIYYKGVAITAGVIKAGDIATFIYNGSQYHLISIDTTLDTLEKTITVERARIDELYNTKENISIIETTETTMPNSCEGRLLFKEILGNTEQDANPQEIKSVAISRIKTHDDNGNESSITFSQPIKLNKFGGLQDKIVDGKIINSLGDIVINGDIEPMTVVAGNNGGTIIGYRYNDIGMWAINTNRNTNRICDKLQPPTTTLPNDFKDCPINHWGFNDNGYRDEFFIFCIEENFSTKSEVQSWLKTNPIRIIFELAEPITDIPVADQVALNSLKTFDDTTYLEIDSPLQPEFVAEYGTSKVGAYTLESLLTAINNDIRISSVEATIVNNI